MESNLCITGRMGHYMFTRLKQKDRFFEKGKLYAYSSGEIVACIVEGKNKPKSGNTEYILLSLGYCTLVMDEFKNYSAWEFCLDDFYLTKKYHFLCTVGAGQLKANKKVVTEFPDDIVCKLAYHEVPQEVLGYFEIALTSDSDIGFYKEQLIDSLSDTDILPGCIYFTDSQAILMLGRVTLVDNSTSRRNVCYASVRVPVEDASIWRVRVDLLTALKRDLETGSLSSLGLTVSKPSKGYLGCTPETLFNQGGRFVHIPANFMKGKNFSVEV